MHMYTKRQMLLPALIDRTGQSQSPLNGLLTKPTTVMIIDDIELALKVLTWDGSSYKMVVQVPITQQGKRWESKI